MTLDCKHPELFSRHHHHLRRLQLSLRLLTPPLKASKIELWHVVAIYFRAGARRWHQHLLNRLPHRTQSLHYHSHPQPSQMADSLPFILWLESVPASFAFRLGVSVEVVAHADEISPHPKRLPLALLQSQNRRQCPELRLPTLRNHLHHCRPSCNRFKF